MEASLREQTHQLVDELTQQQLLTLRMFVDDLLRANALRPTPVSTASSPGAAKRMSIAEYRRAMGLAEPA